MLLFVGLSLIFVDEAAYHWAQALGSGSEEIFESITHFMGGSVFDLLIPVLFCLFFLAFVDVRESSLRVRRLIPIIWSYAAFFLFSFLLSSFMALMLKVIIGRSRPDAYQQEGGMAFDLFVVDYFRDDFSFSLFHLFSLPFGFPSGHATIIAVKATVLSLIFPSWRVPIMVIAFWLSFSRVAVGAHYPSDVIAGIFLGMICTMICARWMARRHLGFIFSKTGRIRPLLARSQIVSETV
ncbi:MAG: phosphatase PAP2 family protein [Alphaproteobacteria bacterium]|nr:phosphatase PAP2 family protein [Alphaproteobacteria bacterium]